MAERRLHVRQGRPVGFPGQGCAEGAGLSLLVFANGHDSEVPRGGEGGRIQRDLARRDPALAKRAQEADCCRRADARRESAESSDEVRGVVGLGGQSVERSVPALDQRRTRSREAGGDWLGFRDSGLCENACGRARAGGCERARVGERRVCQSAVRRPAGRGIRAHREQAGSHPPARDFLVAVEIEVEIAGFVPTEARDDLVQRQCAVRHRRFPCPRIGGRSDIRLSYTASLAPRRRGPPMPRSYAIRVEAIAEERKRVADDLEKFDVSRVIALEDFTLREKGPRDVHLRILAVSAEHNVDHAALADTMNIVDARGGVIYPGNSALGEVVDVGNDVTRFKTGDIVVTHCNGEPDTYGYPLRIWAYDQPDSIGWYGEEAMVGDWQIIHAPLDCGLNLWEMAALPLRAPTAYHLWRRGLGIFRLKVSVERLARLTVLGFGGGVSELFLMLASHAGHRAIFCSGSPERRAHLEAMGIEGVDQKQFNRFAARDDVRAFNKHVKGMTEGVGAHIVCDMLRGPVFAAGVAVLSREGVNVSAGWQLDKSIGYDSAGLSVRQITLDHTHYETLDGCASATELYGHVFKPTIHREIYGFEDLPRAMEEMHQNAQTGIPIVRVASDLPAAVEKLVP